jgi:hypothetical protein
VCRIAISGVDDGVRSDSSTRSLDNPFAGKLCGAFEIWFQCCDGRDWRLSMETKL